MLKLNFYIYVQLDHVLQVNENFSILKYGTEWAELYHDEKLHLFMI